MAGTSSFEKIIANDRSGRLLDIMPIREFRNHAMQLYWETARDNEHVCILFFDISQFGRFGATYGLEKGKILLDTIADILAKIFGEPAIAYAYDDHFVGATFASELDEKIKRLENILRQNDAYRNLALKVGIYEANPENDGVMDACDKAKIAADNIAHPAAGLTIRRYDKDIERKVENCNYLIRGLDDSIKTGRITALFQPIIRTLTGKVCGFETVLRWVDPVLGVLSAKGIREIFEHERLIHKVDLAFIEDVCRQYKRACPNRHYAAPMVVNISYMDFELCDMYSAVADIIKQYDVPARNLAIEIDRFDSSKNRGFFKKQINALRKAGHPIWIDCFNGSKDLVSFPVDIRPTAIKLDMEAKNRLTDKSNYFMTATVASAKAMGLSVVAKNVSTQQQSDFLTRIGCDMMQGYLLGSASNLEESYKRSGIGTYNLMESRCEREYMEKIDLDSGSGAFFKEFAKYALSGESNMQFELPAAVIEFDGKKVRHVFTNYPYRSFFDINVDSDIAYIEDKINSNEAGDMGKIGATMKELHKNGDSGSIKVEIKGHIRRLNLTLLSSSDDLRAYYLQIDLYDTETEKKYLKDDAYFEISADDNSNLSGEDLRSLYDRVPTIDGFNLLRDIPYPFGVYSVTRGSDREIIVRCKFANEAYLDMLKIQVDQLFDTDGDIVSYGGKYTWEQIARKAGTQGEQVVQTFYSKRVNHWLKCYASPVSCEGDFICIYEIYDKEKNSMDKMYSESENRQQLMEFVKLMRENDDFNYKMNIAAQRLCEITGSSRAFISFAEGRVINMRYEYCTGGLESVLGKDEEHDADLQFSRWEPYTDSDGIVEILNTRVYKDKYPVDYLEFERLGAKRLMCSMLYSDGLTIGFIALQDYDVKKVDKCRSLLPNIAYLISAEVTMQQLLNKMEKMSRHDALTNLLNRHALGENRALISRKRCPVGVVCADINGLKIMNDTKGHQYGDTIIERAASILVNNFGEEHCYRTGGDEFIVAVPEVSEAAFNEMYDNYEKQMAKVEDFSMSSGTIWSNGFMSIDEQIKECDALLYEDKRAFYQKKEIDRRRR